MKLANSLGHSFKDGYWLIPLLWSVIVLRLSPYFGEAYSPDSYYYCLLGRNLIAGKGYLTSIIRENMPEASFYSRSYPPVMPVLCGLTDRIFGQGVASGFMVDLAALYGMLHMCYLLGRKTSGKLFYLLPVLCCIFVFTNAPFADELLAGRSIPVAAFLFLTLVYVSVTEGITSPVRYALVGLCLGLSYLTRFDVTLFCIIFPVFLCLIRRESVRNTLPAYLALLLALSPWMIRNTVTFGQPFISSNWVAVASVYDSDTPTLLFFKDGIPSGLHDPKLWLMQRLSFLLRNVLLICNSLSPFGMGLGGAAVAGMITGGLACSRKNNRPAFLLLCIALLWLVVNLFTVSVTKLVDARYFSISILLLLLGAAVGAVCLLKERDKFRINSPVTCDEIVTPAQAGALARIPAFTGMTTQYSFLPAFMSAMICAAVFCYEYPQIIRDNKTAILTKLYADFKPFIQKDALVGGYWYADNFAYYTDWKLIYFPLNVISPEDENYIAWKKHFHVEYLIMMDKSEFLHYPHLKVLARSGPFILIDVRG